jgi:MFS family permease
MAAVNDGGSGAAGAGHGLPSGAAVGRRLGALRHRDFALLWVGLVVSQVGNWMQTVASSWLLLELTDSPFLLGLQGVFMSVPFILGSFYGGALADRVDRRKLLTVTQSAQIVLAVAQGALVQTGAIAVWHIYGFAALTWAIGAVDAAGRQSLVPALVPRADLTSAVALNSIVRRGAGIFGPALGGLAVAKLDVSGAFYANALSFVPVVAALAVMRIPARLAGRDEGLAQAVLGGLRYVRGDRVLSGLLAMEVVTGLFNGTNTLMAVFARDVLRVGPAGLGLLLSASGVGAVLGTAGLLALGTRATGGRWVMGASLLYPAVLIPFALSRDFGLSLALLVVAGLADMVTGTLRTTVLQLRVQDQFRGRVMGLHSVSTRGVSPLGGVQIGALASLVGAPLAVVAGSLVSLVWICLVARRVPELLHLKGDAE